MYEISADLEITPESWAAHLEMNGASDSPNPSNTEQEV